METREIKNQEQLEKLIDQEGWGYIYAAGNLYSLGYIHAGGTINARNIKSKEKEN